MPRPPAIATLPLVLLIGLFWGLNWPAVKFMLTELPPLTVRALAFPCAAIFLAVIARALGHDLRLPKPERRPMAVTGLFLVFGFNALTSLGQMLLATSKAAIIAYTMPALTALLAGPILGERIGGRVFVALAIGMAGLAVLASENIAALIGDPLGPVIMLGAALSWALGNVALKARSWTLSPLAMTVWFFVVSTAAIWPLVLIFEPPWRQDWPSLPVLLTLGYHVLGPMVVCYAVWTVLLGRLPATMAAISVLTAPVVGVLSSVLLLGDRVSWQTVAALLLVVCSIALTLLPARRKAG